MPRIFAATVVVCAVIVAAMAVHTPRREVRVAAPGPNVSASPAQPALIDYAFPEYEPEPPVMTQDVGTGAELASADVEAARRVRGESEVQADLPPPPPAPVPITQWPTALEPCGGDLPPCWVKNKESHGDYNAVSPDGLYRGAWQFAYGTWGGFGGYAYANEAPPEMQDEKARQLWAGGAGCSHWGAC